jgi:plastocyanin
MRKSVSIVLLVLLATLTVACAGDDNPTIQSPAPDETATEEPTDECTDLSGEPEANVTLTDNQFDPTCLIVDQAITLNLVNQGSAAHTFTIPGSDIDLELQPGEFGTLEGPAPLDPGEHVYYCRFHGSPAGGSGMSGTVTIN